MHYRATRYLAAVCAVYFAQSDATAETTRQAWIRTYDAQAGRFSNGHGDEIADMAVDSAGDVIVTGKSPIPGADGTSDYDHDFYTAKYSGTDGSIIWEQRYDGGQDDEPRALALDAQGNVIVTGRSIRPRAEGGASVDWYTIKYAGSDGNLIWSRAHDGALRDQDVAYDVAIDADGNAIVTGTVRLGPDFTSSGRTIKYAAADGSTLWEQTYSQGRTVLSANVVTDAGGNALLIMELSGFDVHLAIAKYAAANGEVLWARIESGSEAGRHVQAYDLTANGTGDLFITGRSLVSNNPAAGSSGDLYTARFAGGTGARIWERRTNGPGNGSDSGFAIRIDPEGQVITAGTVDSKSFDVHTAKYSAADGAVIWENVYDSHGGRPDYASEMVLDSAGNAYVSGSSDASSNSLSGELLTLKVRADGSLAWSRRRSGPGSRSEFPAAIALAPDGGIVVAGSTLVGGIRDYLTIKLLPAGQPLNISTRMRVEKGDNALIAGFIVVGDAPKKVLIRALGPSLGLSGALLDPTLELSKADGSKVFNNDWKSDQQAEIAATTIPPTDDREAAIVALLPPGAHTAIVRGLGDTTGIGLVEVYDLDTAAPSATANISTRGLVQTGENVMIGGLIIGTDQPAKVLLRAIGPSLTAAGVAGALQDPTLELYTPQGDVIMNDDWRASQEAEIVATTVPPSDNREAAIVAMLPPGNYTAIVRGKADTTGVALVEAYNLQ